MGRKPRVDRSPEEKWQIVQEGIKSGNVSETWSASRDRFRICFIAGKMKQSRERSRAWGEKRGWAAGTEKDHRIRQLERALGRKSLEIEILKNVVGGVSCGAVHSQAREMVTQGSTATPCGGDVGHQPVESVLPKAAGGSRADPHLRRADRDGVRREAGVRLSSSGVVAATEERAARESQACCWRVMRERGLLVRSAASALHDERKSGDVWKQPSRIRSGNRT